jgi:putative iron-dependent peroxidase
MNAAQPGIFAQGARNHYHLEFDLRPDLPTEAITEALARFREPHVTAGGANVVIGFGPDLWRRLAPGHPPGLLQAFAPINGANGKNLPATQHDLWVWIHGVGPDLELDMARAIVRFLNGVADLAQEQPCFVYRDSRDLTGFIDGTENPTVDEAIDVALIPDGQPGARGSYAMTIKFVHDLAAFHVLPDPEEEAVFGRTKEMSIELNDKPDTAHIARVVIEEDGEELEIWRRSVPWGTVAQAGLYFVSFSADPTRFNKMLARMYGLTDGIADRLLDFTTPVSGSYYFVPGLDELGAVMGSD